MYQWMDMLYQRYGNPSELMQVMIDAGCFAEWVSETLRIKNEEVENETMFDVWLHKVFDKNFVEFRNSIKRTTESTKMPKEQDVETTVRESARIAGIEL